MKHIGQLLLGTIVVVIIVLVIIGFNQFTPAGPSTDIPALLQLPSSTPPHATHQAAEVVETPSLN